jgi:hypothetical protein
VVRFPFHSAEASAAVNEHIDFAKEKEMLAQFARKAFRRAESAGNRRAARIGTQVPGTASATARLWRKEPGDAMASKTTLNAKNLEALGAERLARTADRGQHRQCRGQAKAPPGIGGRAKPEGGGAGDHQAADEHLAGPRAFVNWKKKKALVDDLETQRRAILEQVAPNDPKEALQLLWRFMGLATSVFDRCDDSSGAVIGVFP